MSVKVFYKIDHWSNHALCSMLKTFSMDFPPPNAETTQTGQAYT